MCLYNDTFSGSNLLTIIIADGFALNQPDYPYFCLLYCSTSFQLKQNGSEYSKQKRLSRSIPPTCQVCPVQIVVTTSWSQAWYKLLRCEPTSFIRRKVIGITNTLESRTFRLKTNRLVLLKTTNSLSTHMQSRCFQFSSALCVDQLCRCLVLTRPLSCPHMNEKGVFFPLLSWCIFWLFSLWP